MDNIYCQQMSLTPTYSHLHNMTEFVISPNRWLRDCHSIYLTVMDYICILMGT